MPMTPIESVYEQYKHMDKIFTDTRWQSFRQKIIADLWQAIKEVLDAETRNSANNRRRQ